MGRISIVGRTNSVRLVSAGWENINAIDVRKLHEALVHLNVHEYTTPESNLPDRALAEGRLHPRRQYIFHQSLNAGSDRMEPVQGGQPENVPDTPVNTGHAGSTTPGRMVR